MKIPLPKIKQLKIPHFEHRELVIWIVGLLFTVFLIFQLLIFPTSRLSEKVVHDIEFVSRRVQAISGSGRPLEETLISLRRALTDIEGDLTEKSKASEVLTSFLKLANDLGIEVISVRPEPAILYPNDKNPLQLEGKYCQALSFQMNLRCSYRTIGTYLEKMSEELPYTFTIDGIEIELDVQKEESQLTQLRVDLFLTTYLFGDIPSS